jgi:periplasmic divalent cation tolerance protein
MKATARHVIVLVTAPDLKTARAVAKAALTARLVACANLVPKLESHYWWRGKLEKSAEVLVMMKTLKRHLPALEAAVLAVHPYDTPEFVALPLSGGNERYLAWIGANADGLNAG